MTLTETQTEVLFKVLDESSDLLVNELETSYLDAFIETGDNLLSGEIQVENGHPTATQAEKLVAMYSRVDWHALDSETVRRAIQLAMLKAIRRDDIQANHQLTPDTIAYIIGYLLTRLVRKRSALTLVDLTVGTGNLLTAVVAQLSDLVANEIQAIGIDNDDTMLGVAAVSSGLQQQAIQLIHQDAIDPIMAPKADIVIGDLPIGYYPLDEKVTQFATRASQGHSFVHHLLIEQAVKQLQPGGTALLLVPNQLFQTEETAPLLKWLQGNAYLQGFLTLPAELFKNAAAQKAILMLQKPGGQATQVSQVMLGEFPSFKDQQAFQTFIAEIVDWEEQNLLTEHQ